MEEGLARWEHVTGGNAGLMVKAPQLMGWELDSTLEFYGLCLVVCVGATLGIVNLMRSPTGRAFVAIRDSEISAQSMGIHLARYKTPVVRAVGGAGRRWRARCTRTRSSSSRPISSASSSRSTCC